MNGTLIPLHKQCTEKNRKGEPCKSKPGADGLCISHRRKKGLAEIPVGFGGPQPGSGRPRKPNPADELRKYLEQHAAAVFGVMVRNLRSDDPAIALKAAGMLADRIWGRPRQAVELTGEVDHHLVDAGRAAVEDPQVRELTDAIRQRLILLDSGDVRAPSG